MEEKTMTGTEFIDKTTDTSSLSTVKICNSSALTDDQQVCKPMERDIHAIDRAQFEPCIDEKTLEGEDSQAGADNAMPTTDRIPYNNGYGDFYFGSLTNWEKKQVTEDMSEEERQDLMGITSSNGVPVIELDDFQRSGPFPYSKLPVEIREKIIRILLEPILSKYHNGCTEVEYTRFAIKSLPDPFDDDNLNYGDEDLYAASERAAWRHYEAMCYPGRESLYCLTLEPVRMEYHNGYRKDWVFLEWIRQASHVSTSFRHELGQVLWAKAVVDSGDDEDNRCLIRNFLQQRPAVLKGIKGLEINLKISRGQDINEDFYNSFDDWCDYIANSLDLELVCINIEVSERDLMGYMDGKTSGLNSLAASSKLRVSECFDVELKRLYDEDDENDEDDEDDEDWDESLDSDYQEALLELMMPDSLRSQTPETEEEGYLQTRGSVDGETALDASTD